jgi:hypothetical protein
MSLMLDEVEQIPMRCSRLPFAAGLVGARGAFVKRRPAIALSIRVAGTPKYQTRVLRGKNCTRSRHQDRSPSASGAL